MQRYTAPLNGVLLRSTRVASLILLPAAGSVLLGLLLALTYELRGLPTLAFLTNGLVVGLLVGVAETRLLGQFGSRAVAWIIVAALAWALAAVLHDQLTLLAMHGTNPFHAFDWSIQTSLPSAEHPIGRSFYGREGVAGLLAGLGSGLPMLVHLPVSRLGRTLCWLLGGAIAGATWLLSAHSVWIS